MEFDDNRPIYIQIADAISDRVLSGDLKPGARIPSVREWAAEIGVNPNTVARSYELLTERGVIFNRRGIGFFLADDSVEIIRADNRRTFLDEELPAFLRRAELLGIDIKAILR